MDILHLLKKALGFGFAILALLFDLILNISIEIFIIFAAIVAVSEPKIINDRK